METKKIARPNRTVRRRNKTRHSLMQAAIALVLEKGLEDTTTDDITELADVGRRTFYNHFVNKKDCIKAAVYERFNLYATESVAKAEKHLDPAIALTVSALSVFDQVASDPITERLMMYSRLLIDTVEESQRDTMLATLDDGFGQQRFHTTLPLEALGAIISWGFIGLVIEQITQKNTNQRSQVWAHFLLQNLGIPQSEITAIIQTAKKQS